MAGMEAEIVKDETGQELVKLVIVDETNQGQPSYAYVTPQDAQRILSGEATLQIDEEGNAVIVATEQQQAGDVETTAQSEQQQAESAETKPAGSAVASQQQQQQQQESAGGEGDEEQLIITEEPGKNGGPPTVILSDSHGNVITRKEVTNPHEPVMLDYGIHKIQYVMQSAHAAATAAAASAAAATPGSSSSGKLAASSTAAAQPQQAATVPSGLSKTSAANVTAQFRSTYLQQEHLDALKDAVAFLLKGLKDRVFYPEPYHKRLGSYQAYQEMVRLQSISPETATESQLALLRRHSMLFRPSGPNSRPLTLYELSVNEAAAQICAAHPALLFHRRDLVSYARQAVKYTGIDFPVSSPGPSIGTAGMQAMGHRAASASSYQKSAPAAASSLAGRSSVAGSSRLNEEEQALIRQTVQAMLSEVASVRNKDRYSCSAIERYLYDDTRRLQELKQAGQLDKNLAFLRQLAVIHGRFTLGHINPQAVLTPFEAACNEAAVWFAYENPAVLTHRKLLIELCKRAVRSTGRYFPPTGGMPSDPAGGAAAQNLTITSRENSFHISFQPNKPEPEFTSTESVVLEDGAEDDRLPAEVNEEAWAVITGDQDTEAEAQGRTLRMTCTIEENCLTDTQILVASGAHDIRHVTSLNLSGLGLTSINPVHLSKCAFLRQLDLSENALQFLPRCLYLPRLTVLDISGNNFQHAPLVEQFPLLEELKVDDSVLCSDLTLSYFNPRLRTLNGRPFNPSGRLTDSMLNALQRSRDAIVKQIGYKWNVDYAEHYKKGVPERDANKVIESFVLALKSRPLPLEEPWSQLKDVLIRRYVGDMLNSKLILDKSIPAEVRDIEDGEGESSIDPQEANRAVLERAVRRGMAVVYTVVKSQGVVGKPTADFLPSEISLRGAAAAAAAAAAAERKRARPGQDDWESVGVRTRPTNKRKRYTELGVFSEEEYRTLKTIEEEKENQRREMTVQQRLQYQEIKTKSSYTEPASVPALPQSLTASAAGATAASASGRARVSFHEEPMDESVGGNLSDSDINLAGSSSGAVAISGGAGVSGGGNELRPIVTAYTRSLRDVSDKYRYQPVHFIRCHSKDNNPMDAETKVWRCAFEPAIGSSGEAMPDGTTTIVATCGGDSVCLIDCDTGKVVKRFKHLSEEFYCLAWTVIPIEDKPTKILAAAGRLRMIRLLYPDQMVCYSEMQGHRDEIACLAFHPNQPTVLFSGDSKAAILVWDIGIPMPPDFQASYTLLAKLRCPRPDVNPVLNLVFMPTLDCLIAGCEDGIFVWKMASVMSDNSKALPEREPDAEIKVPTNKEPCFDGLCLLNDTVLVSKCVEEGRLVIFDLYSVYAKMTGHFKTIFVDILGSVRWKTTDEIYINCSARPGVQAVTCGDNEGNIWIYDFSRINWAGVSRKNKFRMEASKILPWPQCSVGGDGRMPEESSAGSREHSPVVNTTDASGDGQFICAVTDNNLVCIWKASAAEPGAAGQGELDQSGTSTAVAAASSSVQLASSGQHEVADLDAEPRSRAAGSGGVGRPKRST
ncbi:hypothetical protein BOX15_Mlig008621g5 [Macrostomum lignano]|uniref:Uncharacterized protein n=1 Tax=Macrostomum lignano TaxID=282301 RepID=A0A267DFS4_9PLAT|nr:hypothetical protein BOX15_Mlig008621g5 [Macrostomum lignano]